MHNNSPWRIVKEPNQDYQARVTKVQCTCSNRCQHVVSVCWQFSCVCWRGWHPGLCWYLPCWPPGDVSASHPHRWIPWLPYDQEPGQSWGWCESGRLALRDKCERCCPLVDRSPGWWSNLHPETDCARSLLPPDKQKLKAVLLYYCAVKIDSNIKFCKCHCISVRNFWTKCSYVQL